eukprot:3940766-Rhodomonas_salina.1
MSLFITHRRRTRSDLPQRAREGEGERGGRREEGERETRQTPPLPLSLSCKRPPSLSRPPPPLSFRRSPLPSLARSLHFPEPSHLPSLPCPPSLSLFPSLPPSLPPCLARRAAHLG